MPLSCVLEFELYLLATKNKKSSEERILQNSSFLKHEFLPFGKCNLKLPTLHKWYFTNLFEDISHRI